VTVLCVITSSRALRKYGYEAVELDVVEILGRSELGLRQSKQTSVISTGIPFARARHGAFGLGRLPFRSID
jgi:hypothetical protein